MGRNNKKKNYIFSVISVVIIVAVWWVLAETKFKQKGVIPPPYQTLGIIWSEMKKDSFFKAVFATLRKSLISFVISFVAASVFALLAFYKDFVKKLLNPFIVICRSMPTMALVLILWLTVGSKLLPIVVAFLVVFPLCFENMYTALNEVDKKLVTMSKVFKMSKARQILSIYLPAMLPYIFSSIIGGFGLNIKVVISAEVMGLPAMSIGNLIQSANVGNDSGLSFAWLVIAVIVSFICEIILRLIARLCMPSKYPDLNIIKRFFKKLFKKKPRAAVQKEREE